MTMVSFARERVIKRVDSSTRRTSSDCGAGSAHHRLRRVELWHAQSFPFGLVRCRATFDGLAPYELESRSFGEDDKSDPPRSLDRVREITKDDQYGNIANS